MVSGKERHLVDIAAEMLACEAFDEEVGFLYSGWCMTALPHRTQARSRCRSCLKDRQAATLRAMGKTRRNGLKRFPPN